MEHANQFLGTERIGTLMKRYAIPCIISLLAIWYLLHMKIIRPEKGDYRLRAPVCGKTLALGMTSFLSQISLVASMMAVNNMIRKYSALDPVFGQEQYAQIPMAVVGIGMKFFQIVISIVGRCADYILRDTADCLKVFIHADMDFRAKRIVEVYGEREQSPEQRLKDKDKRRAAYHRFYTNMKWGHAQNYHICLDSGKLGIDACVAILKQLY